MKSEEGLARLSGSQSQPSWGSNDMQKWPALAFLLYSIIGQKQSLGSVALAPTTRWSAEHSGGAEFSIGGGLQAAFSWPLHLRKPKGLSSTPTLQVAEKVRCVLYGRYGLFPLFKTKNDFFPKLS